MPRNTIAHQNYQHPLPGSWTFKNVWNANVHKVFLNTIRSQGPFWILGDVGAFRSGLLEIQEYQGMPRNTIAHQNYQHPLPGPWTFKNVWNANVHKVFLNTIRSQGPFWILGDVGALRSGLLEIQEYQGIPKLPTPI
jgi:hypothetical protein